MGWHPAKLPDHIRICLVLTACLGQCSQNSSAFYRPSSFVLLIRKQEPEKRQDQNQNFQFLSGALSASLVFAAFSGSPSHSKFPRWECSSFWNYLHPTTFLTTELNEECYNGKAEKWCLGNIPSREINACQMHIHVKTALASLPPGRLP